MSESIEMSNEQTGNKPPTDRVIASRPCALCLKICATWRSRFSHHRERQRSGSHD